jgi:hypothetical protein
MAELIKWDFGNSIIKFFEILETISRLTSGRKRNNGSHNSYDPARILGN